MPLAAGVRLGAYEITEQIGAGGMGHVYRARDTRLGRDVAVKVLSDAIAADSARLARFEHEARATAALNHPNIVAAYDVGTHDGRPYLVSELLEGATLSDVLRAGALPMRKALDYVTQIASGLAAAHDKGIVHRDLKPANVFITTEGRAKILDFGIAKLTPSQEPQTMATLAPATQEGMVLGTIGYMSPEQIRAGVVDHRTDIFSLGVLAYEMLSGRRPFAATTDADAMSAVLTRDPATLVLPDATIPTAIDRVVRRCLEKLPEHRFQSVRDLAFAIEAITGDTALQPPPSVTMPPRPSPWRERIAWALVAVTAAVAAVVFMRPTPLAPTLPAGRFEVPFPPGIDLVVIPQLAIARDGSAIALNAGEGIYIRQLAGGSFIAIPNSDGARGIAWTPDSKALVFRLGSELRRIDLGSSESRVIARIPATGTDKAGSLGVTGATGSMAFSGDGALLVSLNDAPLHILRRDGDLQPLGALDAAVGERVQGVPVFLPDGRRFFYSSGRVTPEGPRIITRLRSIDGGDPQDLTGFDGEIVWAGERQVLIYRQNALLAQEVSYAPLALQGASSQLLSDIRSGIAGSASIAVAPDVLTYRSDQRLPQQFTWVSRDGATSVPVGPTGIYYTFSLSDDGSRVVVSRREPNAINLWVMDAEKGTMSPMTVGSWNNVDPRFSPDGRSVIFGTNRDGANSPHRASLASPEPQRVFEYPGRRFALDDWSADGQWLLYHDSGEPGLRALPLDRPTDPPSTIARPLSGIVDQATMSPDGRWVAYNSSESGQPEVYVVPFPPTGDKWQVSLQGGAQPTWRRDSGELYFLSLDGLMMASTIRRGEGFHAADPVRLFKAPLRTVNWQVDQYAAAPDGKRFLFAPFTSEAIPVITVITNWATLLQQRPVQ